MDFKLVCAFLIITYFLYNISIYIIYQFEEPYLILKKHIKVRNVFLNKSSQVAIAINSRVQSIPRIE